MNTSVGHLSVHIEGEHPTEVPFLFEQQQKRVAPAAIASLATHVVDGRRGRPAHQVHADADNIGGRSAREGQTRRSSGSAEPGPGGGGGGGGNKMKEPPRAAEMPGKDKITVPVEKPPKLEVQQQVKNEPNPVEQLNIPAKSAAAALESLPGAIEAPAGPPSISQGSGTGGGAGTGTGTGIGSGRGSGLGEGMGRRHRRRRVPPRQRRHVAGASRSSRGRITRRTRCAPRSRAPFSSNASSGRTAASATSKSFARSTRPSASTARRSRRRRSGVPRPARGLGSQFPVQVTIELTFTLR